MAFERATHGLGGGDVRVLRLCTAVGAAAVAFAVLALIVIQCARLVQRNVALTRELAVVKSEVGDLQRKRAEQQRTIRRLHDPLGAVPEIHQRLRLVRPGETIIYVKGASPEPVRLP